MFVRPASCRRGAAIRGWRGVPKIDEVGYLSYGTDAANVLFHIVNQRHQRGRPMLFTTNRGGEGGRSSAAL